MSLYEPLLSCAIPKGADEQIPRSVLQKNRWTELNSYDPWTATVGESKKRFQLSLVVLFRWKFLTFYSK